MKKNIKLVLGASQELGYMSRNKVKGELEVLDWFIGDSSPDSFIRFFDDPSSLGVGHEITVASWDKSRKLVSIEIVDEYKEYFKEVKSFSMTFDSFRNMIEYWKVLKDKKVPEIYFILEDDGSIAVRESLN